MIKWSGFGPWLLLIGPFIQTKQNMTYTRGGLLKMETAPLIILWAQLVIKMQSACLKFTLFLWIMPHICLVLDMNGLKCTISFYILSNFVSYVSSSLFKLQLCFLFPCIHGPIMLSAFFGKMLDSNCAYCTQENITWMGIGELWEYWSNFGHKL